MSRISIRADVHHGKPCIAGTRIPVGNVLELFREGVSRERIFADYYPDLVEADLQAAVQYAIDVINAEEVHLAESA